MNIRILYFASLREALRCESEQLTLPAGVTSIAQLRAELGARGGEWIRLVSPRIRAARNQDLASETQAISEGDALKGL